MKEPGTPSEIAPSPKREVEQRIPYEILNDPETRDNLKERMERFVQNVHAEKIDSLVFLDRSARPLAWLFSELWRTYYTNDPLPTIYFANIGTQSHAHQEGTSELLKDAPVTTETREHIRRQVMDSAYEDRWFDTHDIPPEWFQHLQQKKQLTTQLAKTYPNAFRDKKVLIVDELSSTGRTILAAMGLFTHAFPRAASFRGATIFDSRGSERDDQEFLPWFHKEGYSGVVELPDKLFLSGNITAENLKPLRDKLQKELEHRQKRAELTHDKNIHATQAFADYLRYKTPELTSVRKALEEFYQTLQSIRHVFSERDPQALSELRTCREVWDQLCKELRQHNASIRDRLNEKERAVYHTLWAELYYNSNAALLDFIDAEQALREINDIPNLRAHARQLRAELKQLARE